MLHTIEEVQLALDEHSYVADRSLATIVFLSLRLSKPLLIEGEAGVGKTEVARVLSSALQTKLIRLQGYEGIDISAAAYEWNYARQIMAIRSAELSASSAPLDVFDREYLLKRPLLQALETPKDEPVPVLLIDELDRADDEFEAFLLEALSEFQISIPEIGTVRAERPPVVIITSNRTRELHEALKRRCLYHWIDYPSFEKECAIIATRAPEVNPDMQRQVVAAVQEMRTLSLYKAPGISETLDWTRALLATDQAEITVEGTMETLGALLKNQEDVKEMTPDLLGEIVGAARRAS